MTNITAKINPKQWVLNIAISIFLSAFTANAVYASDFVKIATIGIAPPGFNKATDNQGNVDQVLVFWKLQIDQVLPDKPDLILLPELCDFPSGLNIDKGNEYLKVRKNQIIDQFASIAKANHCYIAFGTLRVADGGRLRNSAILLDRNGKITGIYNKNFPTIGEIESGVKAGNEAPIFQCDFGRVAFAICFDLNFKELREKYEIEKPDIILFPSQYHGGQMQNDWAYLCRSFFVGSITDQDVHSEIRNPLGEVIASSTNYFDFVVTTINLDSRVVHLGYNFEKLSALKMKYGRAVTIADPGRLGAVLLSCEVENLSIDKIIKEFNIELIDDYFNRSREKRLKSIHE